jgi:RNA polymerase sigma factor (sigma-70 family)
MSFLRCTFLAIPGPFFFWKEVKTNPFEPNGEHLERKEDVITSGILSNGDEALGSAVQAGLKRIRSWRVPPNWSRIDWFEELAAVGIAAAWEAVCEFDPARGVPLAGFGYCRIISRCLARYRKEWRYALHLAPSDSCGTETKTFERTDLSATPAVEVGGTRCSNDRLHGVIDALPTEQRRLIKQLFWEERTEAAVASAMSINQSTISRRKQTILKGLRMKLRDRKEFQRVCIKLLVAGNLTSWLAGLGDVALGA